MRRGLLVWGLALLLAVLAWPASAQAPAPAPAPAVSASEAQQALSVLRDDKRRAELISTLDAIAKLQASPPKPGAAAPPADEAKTVLPLEPDSLGAQFITQAGAAVSEAGAQLVASVESVNDLPLLWRWLAAQFNDAEAGARDLNVLGKLAVILVAALMAEAAARLVLRRLRAAVSRGAHAPQAATPPEADAADEEGLAAAEAGESERSARQRRLTRALSALRRLPFLVGRLLLDLVPLGLFGGAGFLLLGTPLGQPAAARQAVGAAMLAYLLGRGVLAVAALLVSPASPRLRLLHISDWAAGFVTRWLRRIAVTALTGYAVVQVGLALGMYRTAAEAVLKLVSLVVHIFLVIAVLQAREPVARRIRARAAGQSSGRGLWRAVLNRLADIWHLLAIFPIVALWLVWAVEVRNGYVRLLHFFAVTVAVLVASRLLAVVLLGGLDRLLLGPRLQERHPALGDRLSTYHKLLRVLLMAAIGAATTVVLLEAWGFGVFGWLEQTGLGGRVASATTLIGVTVLLAVCVWEGANAAIEGYLARLQDASELARAGRLRTLLPMLRTVLLVVIVLVVALTSLSELGVNIAPLLAGAGVVGIAVGFGSQKLVQDLITGLFLLLEDAMQVGDVVTLGGLSGTVEKLSIRTIRLRALDGAVHIIPFSAVTTVTNQTRDYSYAVLDVNVGLNEEPEPVFAVIRGVAEGMRADPKWAPVLLEPLEVLGVDKLTDVAWVLRVRIKTQAASRWAVTRELNRRIKVCFDEKAIESPFTAHRVLSSPPPPPPAPKAEDALEETHA